MNDLTLEQLTGNPDVAPFWQAVQEHRFTVQRCAHCQKVRFPPRLVCPHCASMEAQWSDDAGFGTVYSVTTIFRPVYEGGPPPPYQVAIAEMDVGITFLGRVAASVTLDVGDRVRISFETRGTLVLPVLDLQELSDGPLSTRAAIEREVAAHG